jgi:hypothetical protein
VDAASRCQLGRMITDFEGGLVDVGDDDRGPGLGEGLCGGQAHAGASTGPTPHGHRHPAHPAAPVAGVREADDSSLPAYLCGIGPE